MDRVYTYICKDDIVKNVSWNMYARKVNWSERKRRDRIKPASLAGLVNN